MEVLLSDQEKDNTQCPILLTEEDKKSNKPMTASLSEYSARMIGGLKSESEPEFFMFNLDFKKSLMSLGK